MDTSASNRRLRVLLTAISNGSLIPQPDFQRRLVWTNKDKVEFIKTVIEGYPFPEIYIAAGKVDTKTGEGAEVLVDGQQRVTTLYQFFKGSPDLKMPRGFKPYIELDEAAQVAFLEYKVVVRDLGNMAINEIKEVFQRINSTSYGLNAMEIHNARYGGEFKELAEEISATEFFENYPVFTATDRKRMNDVLFCASMLATILGGYFNRDKDLEEYLARYNESFPARQTVFKDVSKVLRFIDKLNLDRKSRAFKKADFFTLFVELYIALIKDAVLLDVSKTREKLDEFYSEVDLAPLLGSDVGSMADGYYKAALQASNDRSNRILRGSAVSHLLRN